MSTNSYTTVDDIVQVFAKPVETGRITPNEINFFISIAEGEINGAISKRYTVPFSSGWYPIEPIQSITLLFAAHAVLRSKIAVEDPFRADWVQQLREQGEKMLQNIIDGKSDVIGLANNAGSAFVIGLRARAQDVVYSSTAGYVPTMDHRSAIRQEVDQDRLDDEENRALKR